MSTAPRDHGSDWRDRVIADPETILADRDVMAALVAASERLTGGNVIDMRGLAMDRLETRLGRLEDSHRAVIAAAYENLAGTNQVHRVLLALLEARGFTAFLDALTFDAAEILRVDHIRLVLESAAAARVPHPGVVAVGAGFVDAHMGAGRRTLLRAVDEGSARLYDRAAPSVRSEASLRLDLGDGRLPAMVVFAATDPAQFGAPQGTDLLGFFGAALERMIRRHLDG